MQSPDTGMQSPDSFSEKYLEKPGIDHVTKNTWKVRGFPQLL
jgi:hypothetical protein